MAQPKKTNLAENFVHPTIGKSDRVHRYVAIRWKDRVDPKDKADLLQAAGVELASLEEKSSPPLPQVNQTEGLSWVQGRDAANVTSDAIATLEASPLVEWVGPGYRAGKEQAQVFTVNPTRM